MQLMPHSLDTQLMKNGLTTHGIGFFINALAPDFKDKDQYYAD